MTNPILPINRSPGWHKYFRVGMLSRLALSGYSYRRLPGVLVGFVLCIILMLGLWPFHSPMNDVRWLSRTGGVSFGRFGTVRSLRPLKPSRPQGEVNGTVEIWVQPGRWTKSATILALFTPKHPFLFSLHQAMTDLELQTTVQRGETQRKAVLSVHEAFGQALREKKSVFISVTYGPEGTKVYLNGVLAETSPSFQIQQDALTGRVLVGDSPRRPDSFQGLIRGLAFYDKKLAEEQIFRHYRTWTKYGHPAITEDEQNIALYLFDGGAGPVIHDRSAASTDLYIPERYTVINKISMEPFWEEFEMSRSYWKNVVENVVGFLPVGFVFYGYFRDTRRIGRAMIVTVALGLALSLTIEILQTFLPTRNSGTTDLITNTLGTYGGTLFYRHVCPIFATKMQFGTGFWTRTAYRAKTA
jgi:hypothetical protein